MSTMPPDDPPGAVAPGGADAGALRLAAIDIGTNSIHMAVARASGPAGFDVIDREREVVQIGRGSFASGRLRADAVRRAVEALARCVQIARRHQVDHIVCTATAAVREARNGGDFLQAAREVAGVRPRVIPAEEEGRLIYLAVKSALRLDERPALIVDIGGGSVQLVVGDRDRVRLAMSAPLGALRLSETRPTEDPPSRRDLQGLRRAIRREGRPALEAVAAHAPVRVYGSSGAIHALAQAASWSERGVPLEQINGHALSVAALGRLVRRLQRMSLAEREKLQGLDAKRAEIILPGALVLAHVLETVGADGITLSDYGLREGLVTDYLRVHAREVSSLQQVEDLRLRSVLELLSKFQINERHARHVAHLAVSLFDGLARLHRLGAAERDLLRFAALLHDVGAVIGYDGHGEHSAYIIRHGGLRGLSSTELGTVAMVAKYHGQRRPKRRRDDDYAALGRPRRRAVRWLAAILRLAEGLDRSHYQLVRSVRVRRRPGRIAVLLATRRDARLERWAARRRTGLLERLSGARVTVRIDRASEAARRVRRPARPTAARGLRLVRGRESRRSG